MSIASEMYMNSLRESDLSKTVQNQIFEYATSAKDYKLLITLAGYPKLDDEIDRKLSVHRSTDVRFAWLQRKARSRTEIDEFVLNCKSAEILIHTLRAHRGSLTDKSARIVLDKIRKSGHLRDFILYIPTRRAFKLEALEKLATCEPIFVSNLTDRGGDPDSLNFSAYLGAVKRFPEIADKLALTAKSPFLSAAAAAIDGVSQEGKRRAVTMITKWYVDQVLAMGDKVGELYKTSGWSPTGWLQDVLKELAPVRNFEAEPVLALRRAVLDHLKDVTNNYQSEQIQRSLTYMLEMRWVAEEPIEFNWINECSSAASLSNTLDHVLESFSSDFNRRQRVASIKQIVQHPLASKAVLAKATKGLPELGAGAMMHSFLHSDSAKLAAWLSGSNHIASHSVMDADDPDEVFSILLNEYCELPVVAEYLMKSDLLTEESARKLDASVLKTLAAIRDPWTASKISPAIGKLIRSVINTSVKMAAFEKLNGEFKGTLGQLLDQAAAA